jgi:small subunit ribosomal protein S4e
MPLIVYLRDLLNLVSSNREAKKVLNQNFVLINNVVVKEPNFSVGLFDTIKILKYNKAYRVLLNAKGILTLVEISEHETNIIPAKITGKTTLKGGKTQVHLSNGWNFLTEKDVYKTNDTLLMDAKTKKPIKHLKLAKDVLIYIIGGSHVGQIAKVSDFVEEGILKKKKFVLANISDKIVKVPITEVFVIGEKQPEIKLS